jgi:molybdopterin converting factor small subunit
MSFFETVVKLAQSPTTKKIASGIAAVVAGALVDALANKGNNQLNESSNHENYLNNNNNNNYDDDD